MRIISAQGLASVLDALPPTPRIVASGNASAPFALLGVAEMSIECFILFMINAPHGIPSRSGIIHQTPFIGAGMRGSPGLEYLPCRLSLVPRLLEEVTPPDVVLLNCTTPRGGMVSLGAEVNILPRAIEIVRSRGGLVVAQLNRSMPFTFGDAEISASDVDYAIEVDEPLLAHQRALPTAEHMSIAATIAGALDDGATIQTGIGAIPDAALSALRGRRGLAVFSETISNGVMDLQRSGAMSGEPVVTSFAIGDEELYDWLNLNHSLSFRRTELTNDPATIARQRLMSSINAAMQVDLRAQCNATHIGTSAYSGLGGQSDFVVGALHAVGGKAFIALSSWHGPTSSSTVLPRLLAPVTSFQHSFVVTEHGAAPVWGHSEAAQRAALIGIADPRARSELTESSTGQWSKVPNDVDPRPSPRHARTASLGLCADVGSGP